MRLKSFCSKTETGFRIGFIALAGLLASVFLFTGAHASEIEPLIDVSGSKLKVAQASQAVVDKLSEERRVLYNEFKAVSKEIEGLQIYNRQLNKQILNQRAEMDRIKNTIEGVTVTQRQITPLMLRMIEGLKQFVALDLPFLKSEREGRISRLEQLIDESSVSVAEKFRAVVQAYQIENEYGNTIESYGDVRNIDGVDLRVDVLRVGRVSMVYQTPDGKHSGYWDKNLQDWVVIGGGSDRSNIAKGIKVAAKQIAPDLIILPVDAPEAAQ